jgi:hypothetical protein
MTRKFSRSEGDRMLGPTTRIWTIHAAILVIASATCGGGASAQIPGEEANSSSKPDRRYDQGPLGEADFRGKAPAAGELAGKPYQAFLTMDILWSSQYRSTGRGRSVSAFLTQFDATAVSNPSKSWNHGGKNPELLDHEQGHFDITQAHALRLEIKMRKTLAAKKPPAGSGESEAAAVQSLNALLEKEYLAAKAAANEENVEYDNLTVHGTALEKQRELRHVHHETLNKLAAELKALKK